MRIKWHFEKRKLSDIQKWDRNPRVITEKKFNDLSKSIERFGLAEPLVIQPSGLIIGGHARYEDLILRGVEEVDCMVPERELTEEEFKELNIRLNKNIAGDWDFDILANEFEIDDLTEWGFKLDELGMELDKMIEPDERDDEVPEIPEEPVSKPGDIYLLGKHRVMCGDSTNPEDVAKLMDGKVPVLLVTDPPYGVDYDPQWRLDAGVSKSKGRLGKVQNDDRFDWTEAYLLSKAQVAYVWHAGRHAKEVQVSLENAGYEIIAQIIWVKDQYALSRGDYHWKHEPCWYAHLKGSNHNWQGYRDQCTAWEIKRVDKDEQSFGHGTQKPIECMLKPILNNTSAGELVYDSFMGSGTTLIACEKLKRICFGMEIDPRYTDVIVKRWEDYTGDKAVKLDA